MGKNILVLTSSGRDNGNTNTMAEAFARKARDNGHQVTLLNVANAGIKPCFDCKGCYSSGKPCAQDDNYTQIAELTLAADAVVFVMPLYWFTMPAQMKVIFDKMWAMVIGGKDLSGKETALISACEEDAMATFNGLTFAFENSIRYLKWKNVGEVLVPSCFELGAIEKTDGVVRATALANRF